MNTYFYFNDKPFVKISYCNYKRSKSAFVPDFNIDDVKFIPIAENLFDEEYIVEHPEMFIKHSEIDNKRSNNLCRARRTIFDYAICNHWDFFGTITLDEKNMPRNDLTGAYSKLSKFFNNYRNRVSSDFRFLCVPEMHKDQENWHFHLLCKGINAKSLVDFTTYENIPVNIAKTISDGHTVYDFPALRDRFGWCSFIPVYGTQEQIAKYMVKYISKSFESLQGYKGVQLVRVSKGLKQPVVRDLHLHRPNDDYLTYSNDYCQTYEMSLEDFNRLYNFDFSQH